MIPNDPLGFALVLFLAYAYALALGGLLLRKRLFGMLIRIAAAATLLFPLAIASDATLTRAIAEIFCVDIFLKVVDYARHCERATEGRTFGEYVFLLIPFPIFQAVLERKHRLAKADCSLLNIGQIALGGLGVAAGFATVLWLNEWEVLRRSFLLEHCMKVAVFIFTVECGSRLVYGIERLIGFDTTPLVRNVFLSLNVAEFWLRWNNRVHQWLKANVFLPAARRLGHIGGVVAVFAFSGLFHEIAFDVATGEGFGYQFAFFLLQTPMVLLAERLSPAVRRGHNLFMVASYLLTVIWMTATSMLFLRGVDRVFPFFYAGEPWLP